jgi:hypothetical protein
MHLQLLMGTEFSVPKVVPHPATTIIMARSSRSSSSSSSSSDRNPRRHRVRNFVTSLFLVRPQSGSESQPLLTAANLEAHNGVKPRNKNSTRIRAVVWGLLTALFIGVLVYELSSEGTENPLGAAHAVLSSAPVLVCIPPA